MRLVEKRRESAIWTILICGLAAMLFVPGPLGPRPALALENSASAAGSSAIEPLSTDLPAGCVSGTYSAPAPKQFDPSYLICMPTTKPWNRNLVLFAHGYVSPLETGPMILDNTIGNGMTISQIITGLGYAFATTSYRSNGLVIPQAVDDIVALVGLFQTIENSSPLHTYLVGASEGGLVTALAIEKYPQVLAGGLATCGPCGDFRRQIDYFGDFLVVFNYFFPGVLGSSTPQNIPDYVITNWGSYSQAVQNALSDTKATQQLLRVTGASIDPEDPGSVAATVLGVLSYDVFATNDAVSKLGGPPFDNRLRWYSGSDNDLLLNRKIARFAASPQALSNLSKSYQTSGHISRPVVTLHTTGDPIIPYWQEPLYSLKVLLSGSALKHINVPISDYGHCNFTQQELLTAFSILLVMVALQ
jgi:pimeloyl-ACP methyl ester carboxylesterase